MWFGVCGAGFWVWWLCLPLWGGGAIAVPSAGAGAQSDLTAPGAVASVSLSRADGTVTAAWPAADHATSYHVTYTTDGAQSWQLAALDHPATTGENSITVDGADNDKTYIVGVRARNSAGGSSWVNSAAAGPYTPPPVPGAVASVSLSRADGTVTASWPAADHASSYHVTYTTDGAQSWQLAALNHPAAQGENSITIDGADNDATYIVGVRARNETGGSNWVNSAAAGPYSPPPTPTPEPTPTPPPAPGAVASVSLSRSDGTVTATWPAADHAASYHVTYTIDGAQSWQLAALDHPAVGGVNSITIDADNGAAYIVGVRARNETGGSNWVNSPAAGPWSPPPVLVAGEATDTTITMALDNYSGQWYYRAEEASGGGSSEGAGLGGGVAEGAGIASVQSGCNGPVNGSSTTVGGLNSDTQYTLGAYTNAQCGGAEIASATAQTTPPVPAQVTGLAAAAGNGTITVSWTALSSNVTGYEVQWRKCAVYAHPNSPCVTYTHPPLLVVPGKDPKPHPDRQEVSAWRHWNSASSQSSSSQSSSTTFTVGGNGVRHQARARAVNSSGGQTSYGEWSVPSNDVWPNPPGVWADPVAGTTATLIVRGDGSDWYYKADVGPDNTCTGPVSGTTKNLTGLIAGTDYTYTAYSGTPCNDVSGTNGYNKLLNDITFTTHKFSASAVTATTATLNIAGHTGWWSFNHTPGTCTEAAAGYTTRRGTHDLTSLTPGTTYTYTAYVDPGCTTEFATTLTTTLTTPATLTASAITDTTATLTLTTTNHTGNWWLKETAPDTGTCTAGEADFSHALSSLTAGTTYTYKAYSDSTCTTANLLATADAFTTLQLTASSITATTATLTLTGRTGNWWLKQTTPSSVTCTAGETDFSHALSTLTASTDYTYTAYSDSTCTTEIATASFTTPITLTASAITTTTATLTLAGHTAAWRYKGDQAGATCSAEIAAGTSTANLSSLTAGTWYTYRAYSDSGCNDANEIAAEAFSTAVSVSSVDGSTGTIAIGYTTNASTQNWMLGQGFTTGSSANGYTFTSVQAQFTTASPTNQGDVVVKLHAASGDNPGTALWTLDGRDKTPVDADSYEFTCPTDTACTLAASTTYFVSIEAPDAPTGTRYYWNVTPQDSETKLPASNGWAIANDARPGIKANSFWQGNGGNSAQMTIAAVPKPSLSASSVAQTTATLTITGQTGDWWLKRTTPSGGTCTAGESDYSHALTSLTASTAYTYKAYSDSACSTELFSVTFTTTT